MLHLLLRNLKEYKNLQTWEYIGYMPSDDSRHQYANEFVHLFMFLLF